MEFLDTVQKVWEIVLQYKWLTFLVAFGAVSFLIYRIVDFLQYMHVNKFTKPDDITMNEDVFKKKRQRKGSRSMKLLWKGTSSWGAQLVFIASIPFLVYWFNQKGISDGYVYMILIGLSFVLNLTLSKLFPLWTPARPYACRAFQHEKAIQPGNMAFHFWGVVSWSVPAYFFWEYFQVNGWIGSVFFIIISQLIQVVIFIYSIKKSAIPYLEYPGLSDNFKKNMQKYLKEHGMKDSEVGVLRMNMGPNAFATSLAGYKQIVITEELIQGYKDPTNPDFTLKLSEDTIEAITSHEVGHIRHHHVEKGIAMGILISSAVTIAVYHLFSADPSNYVLFKEGTSQQLLLYWGQCIFNTMLVYPITFITLLVSRRKETQADTYLLNTNGCKNGKDFFHQIRHIAPVNNLGLWHSCNGTHPAAHEREQRMLEWEKEHCK
ncbi:M48 family metallopeptidase [Candidatus Uabimicrobium amorphum]|uniref:Peptidase M48 n=1 Tax=Uabimicrobium amorphum TaxID=2596890 RepID=A0A5S9F7L0_UABAM|nr:M48 family metalloprotease [Candidatus Uabimicrobium amorphum]BBM87754.1 peptidase M48 [Candidatus Uabimicrobium amorphum]